MKMYDDMFDTQEEKDEVLEWLRQNQPKVKTLEEAQEERVCEVQQAYQMFSTSVISPDPKTLSRAIVKLQGFGVDPRGIVVKDGLTAFSFCLGDKFEMPDFVAKSQHKTNLFNQRACDVIHLVFSWVGPGPLDELTEEEQKLYDEGFTNLKNQLV